MHLFLESAAKTALVGLAGLLLLRLMRQTRAAYRHVVCAVCIAIIAIVPSACLLIEAGMPPLVRLSLLRPTPLPAPEVSAAPLPAPVPRPRAIVQTPRPAPSTPTRRPQHARTLPSVDMESVLIIGWLAGAAVVLLPLLRGLWELRRLQQGGVPLPGPIQQLADQAAQGRRVRFLLSPHVSVPMTWGVWHPIVVLPQSAPSWSEAQIVTALRHELAHVARRDFLTQNLARLVCAVYWFHPLVWLFSIRLRAEAEAACDAQVVRGGVAAADYAAHLLEIARTVTRSSAPRAATAIARTPRLEGRITMILASPPAGLSRLQFGLALCSVALATALVGLRIEASAPASTRLFQNTLPLPPAPPSDPAAVEFLKQSMDAYAALKTFQAEVDYDMQYGDKEPQVRELNAPSDYRRLIAYAAPNRFRVEAVTYKTLRHIYISDGKRMTIVKEGYNQGPQNFTAPASFAVADQNNMSHPHFGGSPLYRFFAGRNGYDRLIDAEAAWHVQKEKPQAVRFGADVIVDGEPCRTVIFGGGLFDHERRAVISTRDFLVRRMEFREPGRLYSATEIAQHIKEAEQEAKNFPSDAGKALLLNAKRPRAPYALAVEHYSRIVTNTPIADDVFTVPAPTETLQIGDEVPSLPLTQMPGDKPVTVRDLTGQTTLILFAPEDGFAPVLADTLSRLERNGLVILPVTRRVQAINGVAILYRDEAGALYKALGFDRGGGCVIANADRKLTCIIKQVNTLDVIEEALKEATRQ